MASDRYHTIVIGGGISGLCTAHRLTQLLPNEPIRLIEASDYLGGHVRTECVDGYRCDWGPNGFLDREPKMLDWVAQLGLEDEIVQAEESAARRYLLLRDRLIEIAPPPGFFFAPLLSIPGRLRLFAEPFIPARRNGAPESIYDFAARRIGKQAADTLISAMVLGVFGGDAKELSLQHCFPRMAAMEREHGSLFRAMRARRKETVADERSGGPSGPGGVLTSFQTGIGRIVERAAEVLGDAARPNTAAERIEKSPNGFQVVTRAGETMTARHVVLALPAYCAADIVRTMAPDLAAALDRIRYASLAVVCTGFRQDRIGFDLDGFGYLVPPKEGRETLGCLWSSSVFPTCAPEGAALLRTMLGGALHPDTIDHSDEELLDIVRKDVFRILRIDGEPEMLRIFRHKRAIPQYGLHHGEVLSAVDKAEAVFPGLYVTGNAFRGIGMNDCVAEACRVADAVAGEPRAAAAAMG